jgi:osmoprotectant transport system substrate-binding protein
MRKVVISLIAALLLGAGFAQKPIVLGSKVDTEGSVLAQIIKVMLEHNGIQVIDKSGFGTTSVVRKALLAGEIDMYPEYTGTALTFFPNHDFPPGLSTEPKKLYQTVKKLDLEKNRIVWLKAAPANNTWAIAVPQSLAEKYHLKSMADLAKYINAGHTFKLAASQEFIDRPDALKAFEKVYGFSLKPDQLVVVSGGNTTRTETAAARGTSGVNAAMAYGTDGDLAALKLVELTDPKHAVAIYQPAPIVRQAVAEAYPKLGDILNPVFATLTAPVLQKLNGEVEVNGEKPSDVAMSYLKSKGFIK